MTTPRLPGLPPRRASNWRADPALVDAAKVAALLRRPAPTWTVCYELGKHLNKAMDLDCTLEELATDLGVSKQNAYTESVLALGKLAWHYWRRVDRPAVKS